jgi:hypothetical protein
MADEWNCQKRFFTADAEIVSKNWVNWVTVEWEIIIENWVANDAWNRQRKLIHGGRMKSVEKTQSSLRHEIAGENPVNTE